MPELRVIECRQASLKDRERALLAKCLNFAVELEPEVRALAAAGSPLGKSYVEMTERLKLRARLYGVVPSRPAPGPVAQLP